MIFCKKGDLKRYLGLDATLDEGIRYVLTQDPLAFAPGKQEISGDDLYANRISLLTVPESELIFEAHKTYTDIHVILSGTERILCADAASLDRVEADESKDYTGLEGKAVCEFILSAGDILIVFPNEAHKVKCMADKPAQVEKLVVKARVAQKD